MRSLERAAPPAVSAEPGALLGFLEDTLTIAEAELRKIRHEPSELVTRAAQPVLWLLVFGSVLARTRAIDTGPLGYLDFLAPGVLAQSALFIAIFYGLAVIWERDLGIIQKLLVSPAPRPALVLGKASAGGVKGLVQGLIIYVLAILIGIHVRLDPPAVLGVALTVFLGSALFATFSLIVACVVRSRERFMGIGQLMTMPLFFASSAVYPVSAMPPWLQGLARINPLTYMVDAIRSLMIEGAVSVDGLGLDLAVLLVG
ncbi:MAG TPA: ABC transporter permease, partial [Candidatus Limnocylindrales bacterium]|nr:ABC transporter permease [Candidatus Limnocylindrales bacterium]